MKTTNKYQAEINKNMNTLIDIIFKENELHAHGCQLRDIYFDNDKSETDLLNKIYSIADYYGIDITRIDCNHKGFRTALMNFINNG